MGVFRCFDALPYGADCGGQSLQTALADTCEKTKFETALAAPCEGRWHFPKENDGGVVVFYISPQQNKTKGENGKSVLPVFD